MKRRGFWIALVLFVGLAAYLRFFELRRPGNSAPAEAPFLAVEPTRVVRITAAWIDTTVMEKRGGTWFITSPVPFPADPYAVEALLSRARNLPLRRRFTVTPDGLSRYGLDRPRAFIRLELDDGSADTLRIGAPAPASPAFFVQVAGETEIGLLSDTDVDNYFRKDVNGWRRQNLFAFPADGVRSIDLEAGSSHVRIVRAADGKSWSVEVPFPGPADPRLIEDFVKGLLAMKARSYPEDRPAGPEPYGLAPPAGLIAVHRDRGSDTLRIGNLFEQPTGAERYARTNEFPNLFGVPPGYLAVAARSDFFFRKQRPFQTSLKMAVALTVKRGEFSLTLRPDSAGTWRVEEAPTPAAGGTPVPPVTRGGRAAPGETGPPGSPGPDRTDLVRGWVGVLADSILPATPALFPGRSGRFEIVLRGARGEEALAVADPIQVPGRGELWPARLILSDPPRPGEVFLLKPDLVRETLALLPPE